MSWLKRPRTWVHYLFESTTHSFLVDYWTMNDMLICLPSWLWVHCMYMNDDVIDSDSVHCEWVTALSVLSNESSEVTLQLSSSVKGDQHWTNHWLLWLTVCISHLHVHVTRKVNKEWGKNTGEGSRKGKGKGGASRQNKQDGECLVVEGLWIYKLYKFNNTRIPCSIVYPKN